MPSKKKRRLLTFYGLSMLLGILVGLVAFFLRSLIKFLSYIQQGNFFAQSDLKWMWLVGISSGFAYIAWYLVQRFAPEAAGSGVQEVEGRLLGLRPMNWRRLIPVKFLGACFSISSKMLLGREGPTIQIGGNLGAMLAEKFKLNKTKTNILIGAGAASGLAAAFNAPLAGVLFILEEMREHFKLSSTSFKSVMIACVFATIVIRVAFGNAPEIPMLHFQTPDPSYAFLFFIFGIFVGLVGWLFNSLIMTVLNTVSMMSRKARLVYLLVVAGVIGLISYHYSHLVGGGYNIIEESIHHSHTFEFIILVCIARFALTIICYATGIPGGVFAPLLAIGTIVGVLFGRLVVPVFFDLPEFVEIFAVAGMGGLFAACIRAPVTGIVLIVEMTQNYLLILPLMITCITATMVVQFAENPALYRQLLFRIINNEK
jgi:CIC family chloride channel protein